MKTGSRRRCHVLGIHRNWPFVNRDARFTLQDEGGYCSVWNPVVVIPNKKSNTKTHPINNMKTIVLIAALAWQPHTREPRTPGSPGHEYIPKKGEAATFYLTGGGVEPLKPITPNGMVIYSVVVD